MEVEVAVDCLQFSEETYWFAQAAETLKDVEEEDEDQNEA